MRTACGWRINAVWGGHLGTAQRGSARRHHQGVAEQKKSAEAIDLMIAQKYINRSGKSLKDVIALMEEERWMPAAEAKDWGFIDKIIPGTHKKPQVTDEITDCFTANGLPLPVLSASEAETQPKVMRETLFLKSLTVSKGCFLPIINLKTFLIQIQLFPCVKNLLSLIRSSTAKVLRKRR